MIDKPMNIMHDISIFDKKSPSSRLRATYISVGTQTIHSAHLTAGEEILEGKDKKWGLKDKLKNIWEKIEPTQICLGKNLPIHPNLVYSISNLSY